MVKKTERSEAASAGGGHQMSEVRLTQTNGGWPGPERPAPVSHSAYQAAGITPIG